MGTSMMPYAILAAIAANLLSLSIEEQQTNLMQGTTPWLAIRWRARKPYEENEVLSGASRPIMEIIYTVCQQARTGSKPTND